jgi:hypothetical protein
MSKLSFYYRSRQGRTGQFGNAAIDARLIFENVRLLRMLGILKIFSEKMRLFFKLICGVFKDCEAF